jgi:hypothetical protein
MQPGNRVAAHKHDFAAQRRLHFRWHLRYLCCTAACITVAAAIHGAPSALAATEHVSVGSFGTEGTAVGQFVGPSGVAANSSTELLDPAAGDVYIVDKGNERVERFDATGSTSLGAFAPPGGFSSPEGVAVDNSQNPLDPSRGDVYVADPGHAAIDKFDPEGSFITAITEGVPGVPLGELDGVAVDASGTVWAYQGSHEIDSYDDALSNSYVGPQPPLESPFNPRPGSGFAVSGEDQIYVVRGNLQVAKLTSKAETLLSDVSVSPQEPTGERTASAIAVDQSNGALYLDSEGGIEVYSTSSTASNRIERFGSGVLPEALPEGNGLAVNQSDGKVYVTDPVADVVHVFASVTVPDVLTGEAKGLEVEGAATLHGVTNPDGTEVVSCEFEYGLDSSYGQTAACSELPGSGTSPVAVKAGVTGLTPGATYHYRLVVGNAAGSNEGSDQTFIALAQPEVHHEHVAEVTSDAATLAAAINPGASDTTYQFVFGPTTSYGSVLPTAGGHTGAELSDVAVTVRAQSLTPGTIYHYKVLAINALGKQVVGEDRVFETRSDVPTALPDGRAWELVSPPNKLGATIEAITEEGGAIQASEGGDGLAYDANAPIAAELAGNPARSLTQVLARRDASGWTSRDIATPHETATGIVAGDPSEYKLFSPDLSLGLVEQIGEDATPLAPTPADEHPEKTIYLRENSSDTYVPLVTAGNVPSGTVFGGRLFFASATPDLRHVVLSSEVPLTSAPVINVNSLYEWTAGQLALVSILPNEEPAGGAGVPHLGLNGNDMRHAISNDGSRIVWEDERHLYLRDLVAQKTFQLDANEGGPPPGPEEYAPKFQTASSDDSRVFFTDPERLTADSTASAPASDLYSYNANTHHLIDLTPDQNEGESADVQGAVPGAGEDGSQVYVVARGVLSSTPNAENQVAVSGENNLYVIRAAGNGWERPRFVATLSNNDSPDWGKESVPSGELFHLTSRVSPSGQYLAFMSDRSLTGYDNIDAHSGEPDEEVFVYDAAANTLACASCNPTGARPAGVFDSGEFPGLLVDRPETWTGAWLAGSIPGWSASNLRTSLYQSRYLSNDGRLFFTSADSLSSLDINGVEDVYEYEPSGLGTCSKERGCIALLSSGASPEESAFLDASVTGEDAFFLTDATLVSQDSDASPDVYDARVCHESDCPAPASSPVTPCASVETCRGALSPPVTFDVPPTSTVMGDGNQAVRAPGPGRAVTLTRAQKLTRALKACRRTKQKKKRAACVLRATRKYGVRDTARRKPTVTVQRRAGGNH